jgi:hypothetical protein
MMAWRGIDRKAEKVTKIQSREECGRGSVIGRETQYGDAGLLLVLFLLTLLVHRTALVRGVRVVGRVPHLSVALVDHATARTTVLVGDLTVGRLVADGRQLRANAAGVSGGLTTLRGVRRSGGIDLTGLGSLGSSSLTLFSSLTLRLFLLLAGLPFLANLLEF